MKAKSAKILHGSISLGHLTTQLNSLKTKLRFNQHFCRFFSKGPGLHNWNFEKNGKRRTVSDFEETLEYVFLATQPWISVYGLVPLPSDNVRKVTSLTENHSCRRRWIWLELDCFLLIWRLVCSKPMLTAPRLSVWRDKDFYSYDYFYAHCFTA